MARMQRPSGGCEMCGGPVRTRKSGAWLCSDCHRQEERAQIKTRPTITPQEKTMRRESVMEWAAAIRASTEESLRQADRSAVAQMKRAFRRREEHKAQLLATSGTTRFANHVNPLSSRPKD